MPLLVSGARPLCTHRNDCCHHQRLRPPVGASYARVTWSARLGADDFVQPFDDLSQFLNAQFPESLADPFDRQRANLADLDP